MRKHIFALFVLVSMLILAGCQGGFLDRANEQPFGRSIFGERPSLTPTTELASTPAPQLEPEQAQPTTEPAVTLPGVEEATVLSPVIPTTADPTPTVIVATPTDDKMTSPLAEVDEDGLKTSCLCNRVSCPDRSKEELVSSEPPVASATMDPALSSPPTTATPTSPPVELVTPTPEPPTANQPGLLPQVVLDALARQLKVRPDQIALQDWQEQSWPDACLDFLNPQAGSCPPAVTAGFEGILALNKVLFGGDPVYLFRSTEDGAAVYTLPIAARAVQESLATQSGLEAQEIQIIKVESWPWPDTCAYLTLPFPENTFCVKVPLPGWRVTAHLGDQTLEMHTDLNGQVIR